MTAIIAMFLMGSSYVMGDPSKTKQDTWITFILGAVMELPLIFVYSAIICNYPGKNLFEIITEIFGKVIGKIICALYVWYALHLCSMVLRTFAEFIHIVNMPESPMISIMGFMMLLNVWSVKSGPENMGRIAKTTFPVLSFVVVITFVIGLKDMNFKVFQPMLTTDMKTLLSGSYTAFAVPFSETIVCIPLFAYLKPKGNPKKILLKGVYFALFFLLLAHLRNMLILGLPSAQSFYFSSYQAVSVISIGEFFTRMEVLIGISVLLSGVVKMCVLLFTASAGLAEVCSAKDFKKFTAPCALIIIVLAEIGYNNALEIFEWIKYLQIYSIPLHVILPVIIFIAVKIKGNGNKGEEEPQPKPENIGSLE